MATYIPRTFNSDFYKNMIYDMLQHGQIKPVKPLCFEQMFSEYVQPENPLEILKQAVARILLLVPRCLLLPLQQKKPKL